MRPKARSRLAARAHQIFQSASSLSNKTEKDNLQNCWKRPMLRSLQIINLMNKQLKSKSSERDAMKKRRLIAPVRLPNASSPHLQDRPQFSRSLCRALNLKPLPFSTRMASSPTWSSSSETINPWPARSRGSTNVNLLQILRWRNFNCEMGEAIIDKKNLTVERMQIIIFNSLRIWMLNR